MISQGTNLTALVAQTPPITEILPWWMALLWLAALGASIGSFLNVIVYRLPAGVSIVHPGSRCPSCKHDIRARDNIPIMGWIVLRGKCRDCGVRISARYPLVELATSLMFACVGLADVIAPTGANFPEAGSPFVTSTTAIDWVHLLFHLFFLCTLMAVALIDWDQKAVPFRLFVVPILVAVGIQTGFPEVIELAVGTSAGMNGLFSGLAGFICGALMGAILSWINGKYPITSQSWQSLCGVTILIGVYLGWQLSFCVLGLSLLVTVGTGIARERVPFSVHSRMTAAIFILSLVVICGKKDIVAFIEKLTTT